MPSGENQFDLIIIGGGLSGLAAGIRFARFGQKTLILEKHTLPGGLNSYYYRKGRLFETGLHAMTNFADPKVKHAPLNRIFRQLGLSRRNFITREQFCSEIKFKNCSLPFSNDFRLMESEVARNFPKSIDNFKKFVRLILDYDAFAPHPRISTRKILSEHFNDNLLADMILWPLMIYGNSEEGDMDFSQFVILFRSIYLEGLFRPEGTIKDFLDYLLAQYKEYGGEIRLGAEVKECIRQDDQVVGVQLGSGECLECDFLLSTIGYPGTLQILGDQDEEKQEKHKGRVSFTEFIYVLSSKVKSEIVDNRTCIFYNLADELHYHRPDAAVNCQNGVICFPDNFAGMPQEDTFQLRVTHLANYDLWKNASDDEYTKMKEEWGRQSRRITSEIVGNYVENIVYQDSFTPVTIEKFTGKAQGAVYGSPIKLKDGRTSEKNVFIAGTDQGFLGIVGAMLSGISIVNQHILGKS